MVLCTWIEELRRQKSQILIESKLVKSLRLHSKCQHCRSRYTRVVYFPLFTLLFRVRPGKPCREVFAAVFSPRTHVFVSSIRAVLAQGISTPSFLFSLSLFFSRRYELRKPSFLLPFASSSFGLYASGREKFYARAHFSPYVGLFR